jgi:hypothetical protein
MTMRDSIRTWRTATSILAIRLCTSSSLDGMSLTNSWLVRVSKTTLPRVDRIREAVPPPAELCPVSPLAMSSALA